MNKRSAAEAAPGMPPAKRALAENGDDLYIDDGDDDITTIRTASSIAEVDSPLTVPTGATTPRTKFPSDLKTLACTWPGCPKTFNRPARLRDHLNSHTNSRPFKCPYDGCDKDYIEDKHLKQHIKAVHTNERKHVCPREGCGKSFVTGTRLKRHQAVHEGEERFRCQDCGQSFRKKETLSKHLRKEHQGLPAHPCQELGCGEAFDSKPALKRHKEEAHGEARFWCGECGLQKQPDGTEQRIGFTTEVLLQAHVRSEHQDCLFCEYTSKSRWEMEQHVEMYHSGKTVEDRKNIPCPYENCLKRFTKKSNLNTHIRTAHEGFRFVCGEFNLDLPGWHPALGCGDKFCTKVRLEDHIRYKHLGQERTKMSRAESCAVDPIDDISGAAYQAKKTVICTHCDEAFMRYHDLDVHMNKFHNPDNPPDPDPALFLSEDQLALEQPLYGEATGWLGDLDDGVFAAQMDYDPPRDDWQEDEANILLLARDPQDHETLIDPALGHF